MSNIPIDPVIIRAAEEQSRRRAALIENELLTRDVVTFIESDGRSTVYTVPKWRRHPLRRFKIFRLRRRARRRSRG